MTNTGKSPRRLLHSAGALLLGFVVVAALSIGTDQLMHLLGLFPPLGQPVQGSDLLLLAFTYRSIYVIFGSYLVARVAPYAPMQHALVSGLIGLILSTAGAITQWHLGSHWYPIAIMLTALPYAWLGGVLHRKWHGQNANPAVHTDATR
ncbi:MAG: hypothetical protein LUQ11_11295 [Methylococcaceae bacterium]|nr:hypothetical protein [Methylococcaceae bacterium]